MLRILILCLSICTIYGFSSKASWTQNVVNHIVKQKKNFVYQQISNSNITQVKELYDKKMALDVYDYLTKKSQ